MKSIIAVYSLATFFFAFMRGKNEKVSARRRWRNPPDPSKSYYKRCEECGELVPRKGTPKTHGWCHKRTCSQYRSHPGI